MLWELGSSSGKKYCGDLKIILQTIFQKKSFCGSSIMRCKHFEVYTNLPAISTDKNWTMIKNKPTSLRQNWRTSLALLPLHHFLPIASAEAILLGAHYRHLQWLRLHNSPCQNSFVLRRRRHCSSRTECCRDGRIRFGFQHGTRRWCAGIIWYDLIWPKCGLFFIQNNRKIFGTYILLRLKQQIFAPHFVVKGAFSFWWFSNGTSIGSPSDSTYC